MKYTVSLLLIIFFPILAYAQNNKLPIPISDENYDALQDVIGDEVLSLPGDPTFDSVKSYFPAMKMSRELTGVKDHPYEFALDLDGAIETESGQIFFCVGKPAVRFGIYDPNGIVTDPDMATGWEVPGMDQFKLIALVEGGVAFGTKSIWKGYLPILQDTFKHDGLTYRETVFGYSESMSPDKELIGFVRLTVDNPANHDRETEISLKLNYAGAISTIFSKIVTVKGDGSEDIFLKFPYLKTADGIKQIDVQEFNKHLVQVENYWEQLVAGGMQLNVPEQRINDAWRIWRAYNFMNVRKRNGVFEIHDGTRFYNIMYGYSATLYCNALDMIGCHNDSERYLESMLTFLGDNKEKDDRLFIKGFGLPDQGALLFALSEHYQYTRDKEWLLKVAPKMIKMCDWIIERREKSKKEQKPEDPWYGLIFYWPYCDEADPAYSYLSDIYLTVGMAKTAQVLSEIGYNPANVARIRDNAQDYRKDIMASMDRAVFKRDGLDMLPLFPQSQALLKRTDYKATDYYTLVAGCILETRFLPADSREAGWITTLLKQRSGLREGVCRFQKGIDHAYTYGYWMNCMERGEIERVLLGLYSSMAYGMSRQTFSPCETQWTRTGANYYHLPHTYSNTQQMRLVRNMLIWEKDNELLISRAIPRDWLKKGMKIEVQDAPTLFGNTNYSIMVDETGDKMTVRLEPPKRNTPSLIRVYLRHPQQKNIAQVTINGESYTHFHGDYVELSNWQSDAGIEVEF